MAEAETLAREALKASPKQYTFWDTLGLVLTKRGQFEEAETTLRQALALFAQDPSVQVHLAELYDRKGDSAKAKALAEDLLGRVGALTPDDQKELRRMMRGERNR